MVDIPGNSTTTASISVGGTVNATLETLGDHDWFRITLTAGQSITVFVDGTTLEDPYLYIRNSAGNLLYENDDISAGVNRDSRVSFTASYTGTYYIDVGAWDEGYTGDYQVSVSVYTPPPLATFDQIANQLTDGYWGGDDHHFNATQGGSITVNITALTPAGQNLAREALKLWSDVIGVQFVEVSSGGQITFDDNQAGAFSDSNWSGGIISSSVVNISVQWLADYGTGTNSYSFQTYIHEIGHALGLGHAGNYNGQANYPYDAEFQNDSWATSVMSYFSQTENTYFAGQGFTEEFVVTPMIADIIAMSNLYGLSTITRTGNTTYGFNSTAGRASYDASLNPDVAYTIFDSAGTDTLDYSGFSTNQRINLNAETFSNVGPDVGNVSIARGVVIENAIGGSGNDTLIGNAVSNVLTGNAGDDILEGGAGADTLVGGSGNDRYIVDQVGDVVTEFAGQGDDTVIARATYTLGIGVSVEVMTTVLSSATTAINLTGNEFGQSIYGNDGNNVLTGNGGSDYLVGLGGNDWYLVDTLDFITEANGGGDDWIFVPTTYILREGSEIETLVAVNQDSLDPVDLTGNEYGQSLYGSQGVNSLNGGAGNDYLVGLGGNDFLLGGAGNDNMAGGTGNDVYYVDAANDWVIEAAGEGDDLVVAFASHALRAGESVETMSAAEGTSAINLTGNELGQSLYGNAGANVLTGGGGADYLVGGGGNDTFVLSSGSVATIGDYASGEVVDITQALAVAGGTDVVGGQYLRITSGGQLQIDTNGGGDSWVTLANVSGSGSVTVRYLAGGSATDLSIARSASQSSQSAMMVAAVAAAGMVALPVEKLAPEPAGSESDPVAFAASSPTVAAADTPDLALSTIGTASFTGEAGEPVAETSALASASIVGKQAWSETAIHATAPQQPAALPQGTEVAGAGDQPAHAFVAGGIVMPPAEMIAALAGSGDVDGAQHSQIVDQLLAQVLDSGEAAGSIDAILDALPDNGPPGIEPAADHLATLPDGAWLSAIGADAPLLAGFPTDVMAFHQDAVTAA